MVPGAPVELLTEMPCGAVVDVVVPGACVVLVVDVDVEVELVVLEAGGFVVEVVLDVVELVGGSAVVEVVLDVVELVVVDVVELDVVELVVLDEVDDVDVELVDVVEVVATVQFSDASNVTCAFQNLSSWVELAVPFVHAMPML